jgi:Na+-translocating ferredoxin:NAD+ oxidoreductase RnfD subunit
MLVIWVLGAVIVYRVRRAHISATYTIAFLLLAGLRTLITGHPFLAEVAPITGPMYQLFIFFMVTDPKTTVHSKLGQCIVVALVAVVEMALRLAQIVNAPFFALTIVGPVALLIESRRAVSKPAAAVERVATV